MVRKTSSDWKRSAENSIRDTLYDVEAFVEDYDDVMEQLAEISEFAGELAEKDNVTIDDTDELKEKLNKLKKILIERARRLFSLAGDVNTLRTGSVPRGMRGKEPLGYSKPDAGATTDAVYGSRAANNQVSQQLLWPLNISEWDKEKPSSKPDGTVQAEGTKKYTNNIGGRKVHVIIDSRNYSPI